MLESRLPEKVKAEALQVEQHKSVLHMAGVSVLGRCVNVGGGVELEASIFYFGARTRKCRSRSIGEILEPYAILCELLSLAEMCLSTVQTKHSLRCRTSFSCSRSWKWGDASANHRTTTGVSFDWAAR